VSRYWHGHGLAGIKSLEIFFSIAEFAVKSLVVQAAHSIMGFCNLLHW
jgi:hypothetical protein